MLKCMQWFNRCLTNTFQLVTAEQWISQSKAINNKANTLVH